MRDFERRGPRVEHLRIVSEVGQQTRLEAGRSYTHGCEDTSSRTPSTPRELTYAGRKRAQGQSNLLWSATRDPEC
jgi:hypothetical protein